MRKVRLQAAGQPRVEIEDGWLKVLVEAVPVCRDGTANYAYDHRVELEIRTCYSSPRQLCNKAQEAYEAEAKHWKYLSGLMEMRADIH